MLHLSLVQEELLASVDFRRSHPYVFRDDREVEYHPLALPNVKGGTVLTPTLIAVLVNAHVNSVVAANLVPPLKQQLLSVMMMMIASKKEMKCRAVAMDEGDAGGKNAEVEGC